MTDKIRSAAAALLFLVCLVTLTSAFNLPNRSPDLSSRLAFLSTAGKPAQQRRTLTFADRVAYQRAIEEVYWRHRIWPKERPDPKPSLDEVMPPSQLEKKVEDYLRNSQALEDYCQQPITAEQLQAEMDRMARHTKQPKVLRELFAALGNDPFVIAECLARPALSERLVTNFYAHDQRFHGELKRRAESDLRAHSSAREMKQTSGKYSEIELVRSDNEEIVGQASRLPNEQLAGAAPALRQQNSTPGLKLNRREWDETVQKLAVMFDDGGVVAGVSPAKSDGVEAGVSATLKPRKGVSPAKGAPTTQIKTGILSSLQEDEGRYYATALLKKSKDRLKLATVEWRKEPLESWKARAESQTANVMAARSASYTLPTISGDVNGCTDDTWTATADAPSPRGFHTAVWTGSEMIVWGGYDGSNYLNTGGKYNPATDTWVTTSTSNAPDGREYHTAVWSGSQMIVWGGLTSSGPSNTGGKYNPSADSWTATSTTNAPDGRYSHTAVWTGTEMIVWGGYDGFSDFNSGGRYNPSTDSWTATSTSNVPDPRESHTAVWSGNQMIVWGGLIGVNVYLNTGGRYNPATDTWVTTSTMNAPTSRASHTAVWSGNQMIVWGGVANGTYLNTGGKYNPTTDSWTATSTTNAPDGREYHTAVWSGAEMIVWGGLGTDYFNTGGRYNPATDTWGTTSSTNAPGGRYAQTAVWTGSEMVVWGGTNEFYYFNTGGRYNPVADAWTPTADAPSLRDSHTAVWTGSEMIVWGGAGNGTYLNTGGRYNPATDTWVTTSTTNAPDGRTSHTAVWSGNQMIVWGGVANGTYLNTGGRYNPSTDTWVATSTMNAPTSRVNHTAVWTGSEMIVWGGYDGSNYLNTGGNYNPTTDSWIATSTTNAPSARQNHTAVWTGTEMIVWGGLTSSGQSNTGGKYNPGTDSWTLISTTNAPGARIYHTTVWTGSQMIVWGGYEYPPGTDLNTGGRYDPGTDSWAATSTSNAPSARYLHTGVWTGSEMIVWGGIDGGAARLNTGGRYCAQSAPMAQSAFSRKTHGAAGTFDVPLPLTGNVGIECRTGGATNDYQMIINFATSVTVGSASVTSGAGSVSSFSVSGSQVTVNLTGVTNVQRITVTLINVNDGTHMGNVPISMGVLIGDVNGNAAVNASDVSLTKSRVGQSVSSSNFREDVNANGLINSVDVALVKAEVGTALPP